MPKACAYCGIETKLTKEHVWPSCFLDRVGRGYAHYSPRSGKVHGADYVVRDVCFECNNNILNTLDTYFCALFDSQLNEPHGANASVIFSYDYDLLCRSLLKIAYNTARSAGSETVPFKPLIEYILRGGERPRGFALAVELVSPSYVEGESGIMHEVPPMMYRSAKGELRTENGNAVLIRIVAVFSFFFHLLLVRSPGEIERFDKATKEFLTGIKGTVLLNPNEETVQLFSSPQDSLSSMLPLLRGKNQEYSNFFLKQRKSAKNDS